jgi:hypothetical protein
VTTFLRDYWWLLIGASLGIAMVAINFRRASAQRQGTISPVSYAAIRAYSVAELQPYFGTYVAGWREYAGYGVLAAFYAMLGFVIAMASDASSLLATCSGVLGASVAAAAAWVDGRSLRVIGPDAISFESPLRMLSWTVPLSAVSQCDLVPGQPYNRMRVISAGGTHWLPLPQEIWEALRDGFVSV